jgi:hypothetical protein
MTATLHDALPGDVRPQRRWMKWLLIVIVAALAGMWVYAFVFASKDGRYQVDDMTWRKAAETRCATASDEMAALASNEGGRITDPTVQQMAQRASLVDQATLIIEQTLADIGALPLDSTRDRQLVDAWLGYYDTVLADRREYTARLRDGRNEPYDETQVGGGPVSNVITDFTTANEMKSCAPPLDLSTGGFG